MATEVRAPRVDSELEWKAVYEALGQYVANEQCREDVDDPYEANPKLAVAEALLSKMDEQLQATAR